MSRYNLTVKKNTTLLHIDEQGRISPKDDTLRDLGVAFGMDHIMGYFLDIYEPATADKEESYLVELCTKFQGLTKSHMIQLIEHYASEEDKVRLRVQIEKIVMDLPF